MIPKITKGERVRGLLEYLWGPGKAEEHANPRIVAGYDDPSVLAPGRDESGRPLLGALAAQLDAPQIAAGDRGLRQYVWQCSLSLPADDRAVSDEEWQQIAERFVAGMGLAGDGDRAGCRWIAVHHGRSVNGNDHIHIVVTRATEAGEPVWLRGDYKRAQQVASEIEDEFGLLKRTPGREGAAARVETSRAEVYRARAEGKAVPDRDVLRREVRAALVGARDEADWVARMKAAGLLVKARGSGPGGAPAVGYAVALSPGKGDRKPVWIGGRLLDADLSLPRVRRRWPDSPPLQAAEWQEIRRHGDAVLTGQQRMEVWRSSASALQDVTGRLAATPVSAAEWPAMAEASAGLLARVAAVSEPGGYGPVSRAADLMSRAAAPRRREPVASYSSTAAVELGRVASALLLAGHARTGRESAAVLAVMLQAARLVALICELREAQQQLQAANAARAAAAQLMPLIARASAAAEALAERSGPLPEQRRGTVRREPVPPPAVRRDQSQQAER